MDENQRAPYQIYSNRHDKVPVTQYNRPVEARYTDMLQQIYKCINSLYQLLC